MVGRPRRSLEGGETTAHCLTLGTWGRYYIFMSIPAAVDAAKTFKGLRWRWWEYNKQLDQSGGV